MLSTSPEFREAVRNGSKVLVRMTLTLADGTVRELTGDDVMSGSASFSQGTSSEGSFDVGAAVIGGFRVTLNNHDRRFDELDFTGATVVPYVGVELASGGVEWLRKGVYGVDQPDSYGDVIALECLDAMRLLEHDYAEVPTRYPATLLTVVRDACAACGATLANPDFANGSYVVSERPEGPMTCLEAVAYAAQASGNYARAAADGRIWLSWYDTSYAEAEDWLDGDRFDPAAPYASGDSADGGTLSDYSSGDAADGGTFSADPFAHISAAWSATVMTDDVVVTGVRVTASDERGGEGRAGESALYGSEGYVIGLSGNPLVQYGQASAVAAQVGARVVGMRFRPFDASAVGDPAVEAGDPAVLTDRLQNQHFGYLTSVEYRAGGRMAYRCSAEAPARNGAASFSALTRAEVAARNAVRAESTARERAVAALGTRLDGATGLYRTAEPQQDGSTVYYLHDKPTVAGSQTVVKLTAEALGLSADGGRTYPWGLDATGSAILDRIYAVGIDASYIDAGALMVRDARGNVVFSADVDTGEVRMAAYTVRAGELWNEWLQLGDGVRFCVDGSEVSEIRSTPAFYQEDGETKVLYGATWDITANSFAGLYAGGESVFFYTRKAFGKYGRDTFNVAKGLHLHDDMCIHSGNDGKSLFWVYTGKSLPAGDYVMCQVTNAKYLEFMSSQNGIIGYYFDDYCTFSTGRTYKKDVVYMNSELCPRGGIRFYDVWSDDYLYYAGIDVLNYAGGDGEALRIELGGSRFEADFYIKSKIFGTVMKYTNARGSNQSMNYFDFFSHVYFQEKTTFNKHASFNGGVYLSEVKTGADLSGLTITAKSGNGGTLHFTNGILTKTTGTV